MNPFPEELYSLACKIAVVADHGGTGGAEVSDLLLRSGATVFLLDSDQAARDRATTILARHAAFHTADVDVRDEAQVTAFFAQQAEAGGVDVTVILPAYYSNRSLLDVTAQQWETSQKLNLWAPLVCLREAVRAMTATGRGGSIVTVSTIGSLVPVLRGNSVYGATRGGVTNMTKAAALEYAPAGIRVNCVLVGAVEGKFIDEEGTRERRMSGEITGPIREPGRLPMGRGDLGDVAAAVHFLAAPASKYITGQALAVEGGFLLT